VSINLGVSHSEGAGVLFSFD